MLILRCQVCNEGGLLVAPLFGFDADLFAYEGTRTVRADHQVRIRQAFDTRIKLQRHIAVVQDLKQRVLNKHVLSNKTELRDCKFSR